MPPRFPGTLESPIRGWELSGASGSGGWTMAPLARPRQTRLVGPPAGARSSPDVLKAASVPPGRARRGWEGPGGAGGPGRPLAAAPGAGRGWWPHLARAGAVAAAAAGREHGPGPAERGAPAGTPRRLVSPRAARPGPSQHAKP